MTFTESIQTCFRKSFTLKGTASRSEYWYFRTIHSFNCICMDYSSHCSCCKYRRSLQWNSKFTGFGALAIFNLCILPASICVTVRRLHDIGKPGTYYFIGLIPYIGGAILLYFLVKPTKEDSPYREDKVNLLDEWNKESEL